MAKCFVINACGTIDSRMREELPVSAEDRAFLDDPATLGGSSIISPTSRVMAGPLGPGEGILYADIELELAVRAKLTHDFAGHYNRPDVFQLRLNTEAPQILRREAWRNDAWRRKLAGGDSLGEARPHASDDEEDCENPDGRDMS
jgi:nitrilase